MCLLTNKRYKTYQTGFSFGRLGHALGVGLGGTVGVGGLGVFFFRFGVRVTYMYATCNGTIFRFPAPWDFREGPKGQISL